MKRREIEALAERLIARGASKLSCEQPELRRDLKMAAGLLLLLARLPEVEIDLAHHGGPPALRIAPRSH
jgi:hypothetical protein